ncbi:hypothetical protein ABN535_000722 [Campylobacter upsaliensis]|nr:hypothetical protein [Campylobacter upsaliensis]EKM9250508.1 hypothetical protein [Campylobacter upsaliensis]
MNKKIIKRHFCETDLQKLKIKKEKLACVNTLELGEAITIFNTKIKVIENCLKKQNYYEAREKLEELANGAFYEKFRNVFRFNQGLYEKLSLKRKEKVKGVENETKRF